MSRLRVAGVGTGYFSRYHYNAWKRIQEVDLVGIANRTLASAENFAAAYGIPVAFSNLPEMLDEVRPDLLDIITPPETHLAAISEACARRIPIICQKPFCRTRAEAEKALELAEAASIMVVVHENFRFQPWHQESRRIVASGLLGDPYQITFRLRPGDGQGSRAYLDRQPYFQKMPRFLIHETAIHLIDVFRFLIGEVTGVYASLRRINPAISGEDSGLVLFSFASGARGVFDGNRLADHKAKNRRLTMGEMLIEGSAGTLSLNGDGNLLWRGHGRNDDHPINYVWQDRDFGGDCVYLTQRHVVHHMLYGTPVMNKVREYLANIHIEEAIYTSDREGRYVAL